MREHELELIAAFAEGRLEDETEARALIDSAPEFRAEFEAQKLAVESLSQLSRATMSETEKTALHRDLWTELRSTTAAARTRQPWYLRWAPVAAGLFVVVGLVAVVNQGGPFDSNQVATEFTIVTTTVADSTEAADGGDGGESADDDAAAPVAEGDTDASDLGGADLARVLTPSGEQFYAETAEEIRTSTESDPALQSFEEEASSDRLQECVDESLDGYTVVGAHPSPFTDVEGEPVPEDATPFIAAIPEGGDLSTAPIAFVDLFACDLLYLDD